METTYCQVTPHRHRWRFATLGTVLLLLAGFPTAGYPQDPISPPRPPITIVLKGGAGIILADRTWTKGSDLCWESRGYRGCVPQRRVSYVRDPSLPDPKPATRS